jgi:hypothetical protein
LNFSASSLLILLAARSTVRYRSLEPPALK